MPASGRRNLLLGGLAVVLLALAAYLYFSRAGTGADLPDQYTINAVCLACQQEARITASMGERQPLVCPHCGERAAYSWYYCFNCNKLVIPNLEPAPGGGPPRIPIIPHCPICGAEVGSYMPEDPLQKPTSEHAPLPKWPLE
jgi:DNA-directed RNA polymerase subunit RPC12/RpoP